MSGATQQGAPAQADNSAPADGWGTDADIAGLLDSYAEDGYTPPPIEDDDRAGQQTQRDTSDPTDDAPQQRQADDGTGSGDDAAAVNADDGTNSTTSNADGDPMVTVKVNGAEQQVPMSKLIASFQKDAASGQRFEQAAQLRQQVEQVQAQVAGERQQLAQALQHYTGQLQALMQAGQPDWGKLATENPAEYVRQMHVWQGRMAQLQQAQAAQAHLTQQQQREADARSAQQRQEAAAKLLEAFPDWADDAKRAAGQAALRQVLTAHGYSAEEINTVGDHRLVLLADKAAKFDRMVADQAAAAKAAAGKLQNLPPTRMATPRAGSSDGRQPAKLTRAAYDGDLDAAADFLADIID